MANKTMHHVVIGENTYEIVDQYAREHGGATIDTTLSATSTNPVQNKAIYAAAENLKEQIYNSYPTGTAGPASVAVIDDGADDIPVKSLEVGIEPAQTGTGAPSPSNVRAISGWDAVKVMRTGANLMPFVPADEYENHSITLPTTVYGGTLDVTTGILTVDRGFVTWNGSEDWALSGGKKARCNIYALQNLIKRPAVATEVLEGLQASYLTAQTDNATYQGTVGISCQTNGVVGITLTGEATTVDTVKAYLAEHPLQVVYPLATPITYTLTPVQVKTLLGENRIYADAGQVTVKYRADLKKKIDILWTAYVSGTA